MKGLPHALLVESDSGGLSLFVASHPLERPDIKHAPFSTYVSQHRGDAGWLAFTQSRSYFLEVSVSESFLKLPSVSAALYYLNCLLRAREYELAARLMPSINTDKALSWEESYWLSQLKGLASDVTPDMLAVRLKLALALRFGNAKMPFDGSNTDLYMDYLGVHGHVQSCCRLSRADHQSACDDLLTADAKPNSQEMERALEMSA